MKPLNILILATSNQDKLVDTCRNRGHNPILKRPTDLSLYVSDNPKGFDSVYDDENGGKLKIKDIDAVITRVGSNAAYARAVVEHLQHNLGIYCVQSAEAMRTASDKFLSAQKFSQNGIKVPKQWYAHSPKSAKHMIDKLGKLPVILKEQTGSQGAGIILLESSLQTNMTLQAYYHKDIRLILQEFIDNGGKDERHIVVDDKICCSMERQAPKHDIRANVSLEGTAKSIDPDDETKDVVLDMVKSISNLNFAGCDVIKRKNDDGSQTIFALEINSNPGTKIIDVTGHNYFEDLLDYVEANYKKGGNGGSAQSLLTSDAQFKNERIQQLTQDIIANPDKYASAFNKLRGYHWPINTMKDVILKNPERYANEIIRENLKV